MCPGGRYPSSGAGSNRRDHRQVRQQWRQRQSPAPGRDPVWWCGFPGGGHPEAGGVVAGGRNDPEAEVFIVERGRVNGGEAEQTQEEASRPRQESQERDPGIGTAGR